MIQNKQKFYLNIIAFSIVLIFLDAYKIFEIPISWIGLSLLIVPALMEFDKLFKEKFLKYSLLTILFLSIPDIFNFVDSKFLNEVAKRNKHTFI